MTGTHDSGTPRDDEPTLATPSAATPTGHGAGASERPGSAIGPYTLVRLLGEGGFGSVFLAEQTEPVRRRVALKVIKLGMDSAQFVARFEQERQALAMMDHPHIARVFDAGATDTGRPYFVMELVDGEPIVEYCDRAALDIAQRLQLFAQVCDAVQHAHSKGVIHRDIKPSNVLVGMQDGEPTVKVIDFGIAKAMDARLTEQTVFTQHRQFIGTPEYTSPEQAAGSLDIDTRTDVYSLGVLLYELLTGTTPFDSTRLREAAYAEIQRIIREVDPPKPSTRLSDETRPIADVAAHRRVDRRRLGTIVRGELDWIVMKALEKDRSRRYETANGLAMDIRRYLAGEAVVAAPPSASYRLRTFVRRHRVPVAAGAAVALALLVGATASAWQAMVARAQRDRAVDAESRAVAVAVFQEDMLRQVDPTEAGVRLTADIIGRLDAALKRAEVPEPERTSRLEAFRREWRGVNATDAALTLLDGSILQPATTAIDERFRDEPVVAAQLRQVLADRYRDLGLYESAAPLQVEALATRRRELGNDHPDTLYSISSMGSLLQDQGRLAESEPLCIEAMEGHRRVLGDEHPDTLTTLSKMAYLLQAQDRAAEAEPFYRESLEIRRRLLGPDDPATLTAMNNMGHLLVGLGRTDEAETYYRGALEARRRLLGDEHPDTLTSVNNLGFLLLEFGQRAEAEVYYREALETRRRVLGEAHPRTLESMNNMAYLLREKGEDEVAERLYVDALETRRRTLGEAHPDTLLSASNLAFMFQAQGRYEEAEPYFRSVLEACPAVLGWDHLDTIRAITNVGIILEKQGRYEEAEPFLLDALERCRTTRGEDDANTAYYVFNLARLRQEQGRLDEAESLLREAIEKFELLRGAEGRETMILTLRLAKLLLEQGRADDTIETLTSIESAARSVFVGESARPLGTLLAVRGRARLVLDPTADLLDRAEIDLLQAYPILVETRGEAHQETLDCVDSLVTLHTVRNDLDPAAGHVAEAAHWRERRDAVRATGSTDDS